MQINQEYAEKFKDGVLLRHCGEKVNLDFSFDIQYEDNFENAMESISGIHWESKCLENQNRIVEYLCVNYPSRYNIIWNNIVSTINETVMGDIKKELAEHVKSGKITEEAYEMIVYNVVISILAYSYSEYYESFFYKDIAEVLLSGHIPCGWSGTRASGEIIVY